jgi:hypothetical protein
MDQTNCNKWSYLIVGVNQNNWVTFSMFLSNPVTELQDFRKKLESKKISG